MWIQIKRLLIELKPFKTSTLFMVLAGVAMSLAQWQLAVQLKDVFDALDAKSTIDILALPKKILAISFVMALGRYFHLSLMNYNADRVVTKLRNDLQMKFMSLSQNFHNSYLTGSGGMISRILTDVVIIQHGMRLFADFFTQPLSFILLIGTLFYRDWKLTLIILLFLPLIVAFARQIGKSLRKYGHGGQEILERLSSLIKESLDGVKVIQSYGLESEMNRKFHVIADEYLANRKKMHTRGEAASPVTEFISTSVVMVIFTYIGLEISKGQASLGDFGSYLGALFLLQAPIKKIQESFVKLQETVVALERVYSIIDNKFQVPEWANPAAFPASWSTIEFKNVGFSYKNAPVLDNINLSIKKGEIVAIVGESGSGKSTLVNLLQRFFDPNEGEVTIEGIDIKKMSLQDLRRHIGLVTQDVFLFNETIAKNIQNGDLSKDTSGVVSASVMANAQGFISSMPQGFESPVGDRGSLLSGGERQRVSIARALFKNAPILILDEATSALDTASEIEVQKGLDTLMQGKTTIVIAHRLSTVLHADKIVVMKKGRIIEIGNHSQLMSQKGEYSRYIELQNLK